MTITAKSLNMNREITRENIIYHIKEFYFWTEIFLWQMSSFKIAF